MAETITMKKGTSVINVSAERKRHYEELGYRVQLQGEAEAAKPHIAINRKTMRDAEYTQARN